MKRTLQILAVVYGVILLGAYLLQNQLLFMGAALPEERQQEIKTIYPAVEEITVETTDGTSLHGWFAASEKTEPAPLLIYFGGNAEEVSWILEKQPQYLPDYSVLAVNYRGYGLSEGQPSEDKLLSDAVEIYDQFSTRAEVDAEQISVMGHSLGTGVATHLAYKRDTEGVVLLSPYDSIANVAKDTYFFLPIDLLLKHRFEVASKAAEIEAPLLALIGSEDQIVPPERSKQLYKRWSGEKEVEIHSGLGHNDLHHKEKAWNQIVEFLD